MFDKKPYDKALIEKKSNMLVTAPSWLRVAREGRTGLGRFEWAEITKKPTLLKDIQDQNNPNIKQYRLDDFLGNTQNEPLPAAPVSSFPELQGVKGIKPETVFEEVTRVTTAHHNSYVIVDATSHIGFKEAPLDEMSPQYHVLAAKLLERMIEPDIGGLPQILSSGDHAGQKQVVAQVNEIRMVNTDCCMYFTLVPHPQPGVTARIVILGAHGDNDGAQEKFLKAVLGSSSPLIQT